MAAPDGISEKWHLRPGSVGETEDPRPRIQLIGVTRDSRPRTIKVVFQARDSRPAQGWDPGPETQNPKSGTRDPRTGTQKLDFQQIFSVFFETWRLWMNSFALYIFVYFVCFSLPYHKPYTLLIFYNLNELLFSSFFPCNCYEIFKFWTKPVIILRSHT